jgi:hypothetical protein
MPSMIVNKKLVPVLRKAMFAATTVFALTQCSPEEELLTQVETPAAPTEAAISSAALESSISSVTVSGLHTAFATATDCKTCTFVVPEGTTLIDGKEMGFEPGNIICLNTAFKYGMLEFTNMEGTPEKPIVITTVGPASSKPAAEASSDSDPY